MSDPVALVILYSIAFLLNIPLGLLRRRSRRWTLPWIIGCDGSVPILILLRKYVLDVGGWEVILPEVLLALAGNIYGPRVLIALTRPRPVPTDAAT
jgi:hypothetical protein